MLLAEIRLSDETYDDYDDIECDKHHYWLQHSSNYISEQNKEMHNWVETQKSTFLEVNDENLATVCLQFSRLIQQREKTIFINN